MQQRYSAKPEKIEVLYKQSMNGALQDVKKNWRNRLSAKGQIEFLIKRALQCERRVFFSNNYVYVLRMRKASVSDAFIIDSTKYDRRKRLVCYDNFEILHFGGLIMNKKKIFGALIGIVALFVIINVVVMKENDIN